MAANARNPPRTIGNMVPQLIEDEGDKAAQAHARVTSAVSRLEGLAKPRNIVRGVTLTAGANIINHGLERQPVGCNVTHTVADPAFDWALTAADDRQATLTTVGATQNNCVVEFY